MRSQLDAPANKTYQSRSARPGNLAQAAMSEEALVVDDRAGLWPADMVEDKLVRILDESISSEDLDFAPTDDLN